MQPVRRKRELPRRACLMAVKKTAITPAARQSVAGQPISASIISQSLSG